MDDSKENLNDGAENEPDENVYQGDAEDYTITAYCPCEKCCGKSDGITATGTKATAGRTIAVDPNEIPYGTRIEIEGVGVRIAEDCGGAVSGKKIDLFFETHEQAKNWGKQIKKVKILK